MAKKDTYIPRNELVDMNKELDRVRKQAEDELMKTSRGGSRRCWIEGSKRRDTTRTLLQGHCQKEKRGI